jgi:hypothetical protein
LWLQAFRQSQIHAEAHVLTVKHNWRSSFRGGGERGIAGVSAQLDGAAFAAFEQHSNVAGAAAGAAAATHAMATKVSIS